MDNTPPAGYRYRTWKFGEQPGHALARTIPGNEAKGAVTWKDVKDWPLYDALMVVDEENLPPSNVILSSELAYKVIRVVLATGCLTLCQLYRFWPANYTTTGSPVTAIEPMGRPALVKTEDGILAYGMWCGYAYCGTVGLNAMTGIGDLQVTRRAMNEPSRPSFRRSTRKPRLREALPVVYSLDSWLEPPDRG